MEDKQTKKIKRYLEDVSDGRDDLLQSTEKIISSASLQVQYLLNTQVPLSQKESLLKYLTKIVVLFTELNHSVLKFLETEPLPVPENVQTCSEFIRQEQSPTIHDLSDYFKANLNESISMFDFSTNGPKVSNSQVQNDSYIRKPLDNTTLKAICSNFINNSRPTANPGSVCGENESKQVPVVEKIVDNNEFLHNNITSTDIVDTRECTTNTVLLIKEGHDVNARTSHMSPTFSSLSESEVFSTASSVVYQHPLSKFQPPLEVPKQYDTQDLEQIKENLLYLSKKMGFDSERLSEMKSQFHKNLPRLNYEYEEPVKEIQEGKEDNLQEDLLIAVENNTEHTNTINTSTEEVTTLESTVTDQNENKAPQKCNYNLKNLEGTTIVLNNQTVDGGPSKSTGAVRKQKLPVEDLIEFSASTSDSESCEKVSTWLNNNTLSKKHLDNTESNTTSEELNIKQNSAIEKLHNVKRHDRNEEAREQARRDMPDLKFVPVEVPKVIKNDLNSESSSEKKNYVNKKKVKDLNKENGVYEITRMEQPEVGTVGVFSHIVSPDEFYLQFLSDTTTAYLDEISEKLDVKFRKTETVFRTKHEAFERLGKFCFGYILGDKAAWYRLQVLDWELVNKDLEEILAWGDSNQVEFNAKKTQVAIFSKKKGCPSPDVEVKSVDYGFRCRTSYEYLREMSKDLAHIPMLAIQCHFPLLYPPGSTFSYRLQEWPTITIEALHDMVNLHDDSDTVDIKMFQITLAELEGDSLAVDMVTYGEENADSLRNVLLDSGLATDIMEDYGEHPELGEFLEDLNQLEESENLNELIMGYDAKDEMRVCRFTRNDGTCYKGKNCKLEHITLKDGYTTDKTTVFYTAINDPIFPNKGEIVQVLVTAYIDSCTYLVQLIRNPVVKENTNLLMDRDISDLMDAMNHPKKVSKYEHFKVYPAVGELILAYYSLSKMWMRVAVRELKYDKNGNLLSIEVYAVDFGDQFTVKLRDTRVMIEDLMHVPFQVIQIYLDGYQHRVGCDLKKAKRFFEKHISYKGFLAHIKSRQPPFKVGLTTFKGREIGPTLIKEGFAEKRTMDIQIAEGRKMDLE